MNNKTILQEAFKKFDLLEEETFHLDGSPDAAEDAKEFMDAGDALDMLDVIDPEAETEEDIEDSYTDKVILDCNVCHSKIYKDPDEIKVCEDEDCVNKDEECPFCYSSDGYKIIGQVKPYKADPIYDITVEPKDEDDEDEEVEEDEDDVAVVEESYKKRSNKYLRESRKRRSSRLTEGRRNKKALREAKSFSLSQLRKRYQKAIKEYPESDEEKVLIAVYDGRPGDDDSYMETTYRNFEDFEKDFSRYQGDDYWVRFELWEFDGDEEVDWIDTVDGDLLIESLENIDLETEHDKIHIEAEEKVESDGEMLAPLEPEMEDEIEDVQEVEDEEIPEDEEMPEDEEVDYDIDEFDEDTFDGLGESYLKRVYENVNSFKTNSVTEKGNKWIVEGTINFKSGKTKPTKFIFEAFSANKNGRLNFVGENAQISRGKKSFKLSGALDNKKFFAESLNYNYRQKDASGKSVRVYGTVKR